MKLPTAGLLIIRDRRLLLAYSRNKQCFYLPGGKIHDGESPATALCREIAEEMDISISEDELHYYTHITAPAYGESSGTIMEQECFLLTRDVLPRPSAEIAELKFFSLHEYLSETHRAPDAVMVLLHLKNDNLVD